MCAQLLLQFFYCSFRNFTVAFDMSENVHVDFICISNSFCVFFDVVIFWLESYNAIIE